MKLCIVSDSHDNRDPLNAAVAEAKASGAEAVLHCGDIVAPSTLRTLRRHGLPVHAIHGNNTGDTYSMAHMAHEQDAFVRYYGQDADIELGGKRFFLVHYPHYAYAMACTGDWDVVCCGHDHVAAVRSVANVKGGQTMLVNPGTVGGIGAATTYVLADLTRWSFEIRTLP
ncbi:MAG: metallophosphoesterase family protein [Gammaproteobacteria bacterium]|nr:metallophosphoesterase family protein [Gammaproteobacteria bacterium]